MTVTAGNYSSSSVDSDVPHPYRLKFAISKEACKELVNGQFQFRQSLSDVIHSHLSTEPEPRRLQSSQTFPRCNIASSVRIGKVLQKRPDLLDFTMLYLHPYCIH